MPLSVSVSQLARLAAVFVAASLSVAGCAGKSTSHGDDAAAANGSGANGGAAGSGATGGGSGNVGTGGSSAVGGSTDPGKGGSDTDPGKGGSDSGAMGGSGAMPSCTNVVCAPIPTTCKKIVQPPDECCPLCPETG